MDPSQTERVGILKVHVRPISNNIRLNKSCAEKIPQFIEQTNRGVEAWVSSPVVAECDDVNIVNECETTRRMWGIAGYGRVGAGAQLQEGDTTRAKMAATRRSMSADAAREANSIYNTARTPLGVGAVCV